MESSKSGSIETWDVSKVTDMSELFTGYDTFNKKLLWDVSNVTNMKRMFWGCEEFNQTLDWDVSKVTNMSGMFEGCKKFNKPLIRWNVKNVLDAGEMFYGCSVFNQPLDWEVGRIKMDKMFWGCKNFNQDLTRWKPVSHIDMFKNCNLHVEKYPSFVKVQKRCKNGTRKTKSGECVSIRDLLHAQLKACLDKRATKRCEKIKDKIDLLDKNDSEII
jgi:hypothetical protein